MIVATQYVRIRGKMYSQGEIIPDSLPAETLERLANLGAVAITGDRPREPVVIATGTEVVQEVEPAAEPVIEQEINVSDGIVKARKRGRRKNG